MSTLRRILPWTAVFVLSLVLIGFVSPAAAGGPDEWITALSTKIFGWIQTIVTAIAAPIIAFGVLKWLATQHNGDAQGHSTALGIVRNGLIAVAIVWALPFALSLVQSTTTDLAGQVCNVPTSNGTPSATCAPGKK